MAWRTTAGAVAVALSLAGGCSAGDPPDPDAARAEGGAGTPAAEAPEAEVPEADDAALDAIEERYEDAGVDDVRAGDDGVVTIRVDDDGSAADAAAACAAVRDAGFAEVQVDRDGVVEPCP